MPKVEPNTNAPGAKAFTDIVGSLMFYGLLSGMACIAISAIVYGVGRWMSHHGSAQTGRVGIFAGIGVAGIVGGIPALINWGFGLGASI
ncbi:DUF6112 family protein [Streptomyces sp. NPDC059193]|uniref:DUF6112 family protein n=1 Tax=Streptomyces sp. NPDC059193 TaxID=3346763 RepID=UPI0036C90E85